MNLLVLCHGNINRSPFVAAVIRAARPGWTVESAGLAAKPGGRARPRARNAALGRGLSLEDHRSQQVTPEMIAVADVVLYMDGGNEKRLRDMMTELQFKLKGLALGPVGGLTRVPDPNYMSDPAEVARAFHATHSCALAFLARYGS